MTTYEQIEMAPIMVVKKDGRRERFERSKLMAGMIRACEKRPVPMQDLETVCDQIEAVAQDQGGREIDSQQIGELVMERLRGMDDIAYVRFASVYRHFRDINVFMEELKSLLDRPS